MKNFLLTVSAVLCVISFSLAQDNIPVTYNFTGFGGVGFAPTPASGELNSDSWRVTGMSDGDGTFGGTHNTGDFARGNSASGGVGTGGTYSLNSGAIWIQPIGSDFNPGTIELKVCNNSGSTMANIQVNYDIYYLNDQERANSLNFSWDKVSTMPAPTTVSAADFTSPEASDALGIQNVNRSFEITGANLATGDCLILIWTGADVSGGGSRDEMGIDNVSVEESIAQPVTLTSFEAKNFEDKSVTLTWQTASEENNDYFSIEHSTDGTSFREIATQVGNGTTDKVQNYSFLHEEVENGLHYYRLKQVDFDGKFEYTNIVTAKVSHSNDDIFLTPNPTSNVILIQTKPPYERDADFQILNMQGQVVLSSVLQEGTTNLELNIADFPVGIYYLQLFVDNDVMMKKIIKQ